MPGSSVMFAALKSASPSDRFSSYAPTFGDRLVEVQRVTEFVHHDVGDPAGILAVRRAACEVDVGAARERVTRIALVDVEHEWIEPGTGGRIDPLRALGGGGAVDVGRDLRVVELAVRRAPDRAAAGEHGERGRCRRAGLVDDHDLGAGTAWSDGGGRGGGPRERAGRGGRRRGAVDGDRGGVRRRVVARARGVADAGVVLQRAGRDLRGGEKSARPLRDRRHRRRHLQCSA